MDSSLNSFEFNNDSVLRGCSIAHGILICIALLGTWIPLAYLFYNFLFLVALGLTIHSEKNSHWSYQLSWLSGFALLMDIIVLASHWPSGNAHGINGFSLAATFFNMFLRFCTFAFAMKVYREKRQQHYQTGATLSGYEEFPPARPDTTKDASPLAP